MSPSPQDSNSAPAEAQQVIRWAEMTWRDCLRVGIGAACFLLGIAGLVLPILQGVLFILIAAVLIAPYLRSVQKQLMRCEAKFPWLAEKARGLTARWQKKPSVND